MLIVGHSESENFPFSGFNSKGKRAFSRGNNKDQEDRLMIRVEFTKRTNTVMIW